MTISEVVEQMDRLALAGFYVPARLDEMAAEWFTALEHVEAQRLATAIDVLMTRKTERWWPTLGEVMQEVQALRAPEAIVARKCARCQGSRWVEDIPFRGYGLGDTVYTCVARCPDCGVPPPDTAHLERSQRKISAAEQRARLLRNPPMPDMTEEHFLARLRALGQGALASTVQRHRTFTIE